MYICKNLCNFAAENYIPVMDTQKKYDMLKHYLLNKYVIAILLFFVIMLFSDNSIVKHIQRRHQISELEEKRDAYDAAIQDAKNDIERLQSQENLEQFAREKYFMHAPDEQVYIVKE